jgi:O-acetylhomoserine/O-acetylserine sulfhydrylase-like pyridoxal-dependent enzyme
VQEVSYLGLKNHPLYAVATRYLKLADSNENRYTHLLAFRPKGGPEATRQVFDRFQLIYRATDLGRIKSVATIPAISTHLLQGEECREMACIPPDLIRLSVGGEDPADIIADLDQALSGK